MNILLNGRVALASLVLNILDNAIEAAQKAPHGEKRLRIDMHCKRDYFVFPCENTAAPSVDSLPEDGLNYHGYGQQLIEKSWRTMEI